VDGGRGEDLGREEVGEGGVGDEKGMLGVGVRGCVNGWEKGEGGGGP